MNYLPLDSPSWIVVPRNVRTLLAHHMLYFGAATLYMHPALDGESTFGMGRDVAPLMGGVAGHGSGPA